MSKRSKPQFNDCQADILKLLVELHQKVDNLTALVKSYQNDAKNQSNLVVDALGENNVAIKNIVKHQNPKYTKTFPIKTLDDLHKFNDNIDDTNENEYITSVRAIVGQRGLKKGLKQIVVPEVLAKFNVEGVHNKMRLLNLQKFVNVLLLACYDEQHCQNSFKEELKYALKLAKNCYVKEKSNKSKENTIPTTPATHSSSN